MAGDDVELAVAWQRFVGTDDTTTRWFDELIARHREPHRSYHGTRHLCWVVRHVLEIASDTAVNDLDTVIAAAFFHDSVYEPARTDNEAASARLASNALREIGWSPERTESVEAMILATTRHEAGADDPTDTTVLLAADLAVLASDAAAYGAYVRGIRREYAHVVDDDWRAGRAAVLRSLLERPAIFDPSLGLDGWERRARANITAELATLAASRDTPGSD